MNQHSRELETWVRLVTPTVKRALAGAAQYLCDTNYNITDFITPARPEPMAINELVNELLAQFLGAATIDPTRTKGIFLESQFMLKPTGAHRILPGLAGFLCCAPAVHINI